MYNDRIYADGVHSVLLAEWELLCKTPLVIRNGHQIAYGDSAPIKTRYRNLQLKWREKQNQEYEVAALHYGYEIRGNRVCSYHFVPPSSIRGALRSWSIRQLVHPKLHSVFIPVSNEDAASVVAHKACVQGGLSQCHEGCELIASLFGLAAYDGEENLPSNAGRLHIETERFAGENLRPVDVSGIRMATSDGPDNVRREMPVRNPLDRMTHASRDAGLHRFLEVASGEKFKVHLRIVNPLDCDIGLLGLWVRELNYGMLRIGALSSIGRGRMEVQKQKYGLWRRANAPRLQEQDRFSDETDGNLPNDILSGLWKCHTISAEALLEFTPYLREFTGGSIDDTLSESI
ncbi:MAG: RAMP superfamily CRISPR-associated protein [Methanothrix sp.]|nr:RAMP superfamily CRISPR-associated protein [Methanothrix sp.]